MLGHQGPVRNILCSSCLLGAGGLLRIGGPRTHAKQKCDASVPGVDRVSVVTPVPYLKLE